MGEVLVTLAEGGEPSVGGPRGVSDAECLLVALGDFRDQRVVRIRAFDLFEHVSDEAGEGVGLLVDLVSELSGVTAKSFGQSVQDSFMVVRVSIQHEGVPDGAWSARGSCWKWDLSAYGPDCGSVCCGLIFGQA